MESIKEFLGCGCAANRFFSRLEKESENDGGGSKTPGYTFPWAETKYSEERPVIPTHESLDLSVNIEKEELSGVATIDFKVMVKEVDLVKINAVDLHIHDVQFGQRGNWQVAKFSVSNEHVTVNLPAKILRGDQGQLKIVYSTQKPKAGIYFIKPDAKYPKRPTQVWTQGQDDDARYWFPCFDEPKIKCSYDVKVEVPAGYIATSNGALHSEVKGGKTTTFHWKTQFLIPSYLVTLTVGKFSEIKDEWRGKPVTYLVEKGMEQEGKISFGKTPKMLELFSQKIGVDYPYEKYTQIAAAEFVFGGMENTSATTQTDATLHPIEIEEDFTSDDLVAHELGHQWFGDLVTCKTWSHGWLNEGWATFMEYTFKESDLGLAETEYYRYQDLNVYLDEDTEFRRPIVTNFYTDPAEIWDRHTYQKAGLVLQTLKSHIGDDDFWAGTKRYLETHRGGTVETVDFQRALENSSGQNLQPFFDQWIYKTGFPEFKFTMSWDEKTKLAKVKLEQKQKVDKETSLFHVRSEIDFVFADKTHFKLPVETEEKEQTFYIPLKQKPVYAVFDRGNHLLKSFEMAIPVEMMKVLIESDEDVVSKIWAMKTLAKEASSEGIEILIQALKSDSFWGVRAEAATALGSTKMPAAQLALINCLKEEKKSKVRSKICSALGNFKDEKSGTALIERFENEKNIFVRGAAVAALGKTNHPKAKNILEKALKIESWHDLISAQSYAGLKHLHDDSTTELFMEGAKYGAPKYSRLAAISGLSEQALDKAEVREFLVEALNDPFIRARHAAASALVGRRDGRAVGALENAADRVVDGHFKATARRAASRIRKNLKKPEEFVQIREKMDKLSEENKKLIERMDKLDKVSKASELNSPV